MTTIESMRETLATYTRQKAGVVDQLLSMNSQLISAKSNRDKRRIQTAIRNLEQQDRRLDDLIKSTNDDIKRVELSENKFDAKTEAYKAGIDPNAAWANAISSGVQSVSGVIGQFAGANAISKLTGKPQTKPSDVVPPKDPKPTEEKDNTMLYVGLAVVAFIMFKK
jgi:hypothetical protein